MAYVIPREIEGMTNAFLSFSMNKPYLQAVLGADYTFGEIYLEGQYIYYQNGSLLSPCGQYETGGNVASWQLFDGSIFLWNQSISQLEVRRDSQFTGF